MTVALQSLPSVPTATRRRRRLALARTVLGHSVRAHLLPAGARRRQRLQVCGAADTLTALGVRVQVFSPAIPWPRSGRFVISDHVGRLGDLAVSTAVRGPPTTARHLPGRRPLPGRGPARLPAPRTRCRSAPRRSSRCTDSSSRCTACRRSPEQKPHRRPPHGARPLASCPRTRPDEEESMAEASWLADPTGCARAALLERQQLDRARVRPGDDGPGPADHRAPAAGRRVPAAPPRSRRPPRAAPAPPAGSRAGRTASSRSPTRARRSPTRASRSWPSRTPSAPSSGPTTRTRCGSARARTPPPARPGSPRRATGSPRTASGSRAACSAPAPRACRCGRSRTWTCGCRLAAGQGRR